MTVLKSNQTFFSLPLHGPWLLFAIWLVVQCYVFFHFGISEGADSDFYMTNAKGLLQGHFPEDRGIWYTSYSLFLALVIVLGGNSMSIVLVQFFFSGLAAIALYKVVLHLFQNHFISFLAVLQYLLWLKIHQWNSYIYTESLFISFSIFSFALLSVSKKASHYFFTALIIGFTLFLRPTGICFFIATCGYFCFLKVKKEWITTANLLIVTPCIAIVLWILSNIVLRDYVFLIIDGYRKVEIIYPNISLGFSAAAHLDMPSAKHPPLLQLMEFVIYNPLYFLKLSSIKLLLFLGNVKPYFTWIHNLLIVILLYPIYIFAGYGFKKMNWSAENVWMMVFILMQILIVSITSENWDGRFHILILPFVFIYSAFGIAAFFQKNIMVKTKLS